MLKPIKNKKSKIKQKRRRIALFVIVILFIIGTYISLRAKNYEKNYQIQDFTIKEKYNKEFQTYSFLIEKEDNSWYFTIEEKYKKKKKLIQEIEYLESEDTKCIVLKSEKLITYPQCQKDKELIDYHLVSETIKNQMDAKYFATNSSKNEDYEKVTLKNLDSNTYFIWNYKGFYKIDSNKKENISLFTKDIYNVTNIASVKDYLIIPDYNATHYFNKFYIINMKDGKISEWNFKDSIYFDGYYLGTHNNSLFYLDKKMKVEWELLPKKKKMRRIGTESKEGKILIDNEWEKISVNKLINDSKRFEEEKIIEYEIDNGLIINYQNGFKKIISQKNVKDIVAVMKNKVYYLVDDTLYYYEEALGEVEVMSYFEWNFNYKNMIFIRENN